MITQIVYFLNTKGQFEITAEHANIEQTIEAIKVKNLISKKEKFKVFKEKNNFFFLRNGNILADQMVTEKKGKFYMKELTVDSLNELESEL